MRNLRILHPITAKRLVMLPLVLVASIVCAASYASAESPAASQPDAPRPAATQPAATQPAATQPVTDQSPVDQSPKLSLLEQRDGDPLGSGETTKTLLRMLSYALVILVLGGVALVVVKKKWMQRIVSGSGRGKQMSVVETIYIAPRKTLHLVQVGGRRFLLGSTKDGLSMLAEVTKAFDEVLADQAEDPHE